MRFVTPCIFFVIFGWKAICAQQPATHPITPLSLTAVHIDDLFWSPRIQLWRTKTVYDVFDKLEGKYEPDRKDLIEEKQQKGSTRNAFLNFDRVAAGEKDTKHFDGLPWFDGLIYETIRAAADLLVQHPDGTLEKKVDAYIQRIAAAQSVDNSGYINTYTTLNRSNQRWGANGGDDKWQHDMYNAGMLIDAAVHYYNATHKTALLLVAVKQSNCICNEIGPVPKVNAIPGHGGPEEAMLKLYQLFKDNPAIKKRIAAPVDEDKYYDMAKFWIENRGHYGGDNGYAVRNSDGSYNQDHMPVLQQITIEGHAVRATLLAAGVTAMALENNSPDYIRTAGNYWNNMIGKRMFITGGEGAIADQERFGPDYFLPESAYLETCAAVGAGFFSERMNQLFANGQYVDELERVLYNNMLSGISLTGDHYFYENPLMATGNNRWAWHSCPCCPPMFLKMIGALPGYIYAHDANNVYVNLFIGSNATVPLAGNSVRVQQQTQYPWQGSTAIAINPAHASTFTVFVRIPGWAQGKENPWNLYTSTIKDNWSIKVNGQPIATTPVNGYAAIIRTWKKGDRVEVSLPIQPRWIHAHDSVTKLQGKVAIAAGPVVYALEGVDNPRIQDLSGLAGDANRPDRSSVLTTTWQPDLLGGINTIQGAATTGDATTIPFTAIPFYAIANRTPGAPYKVWLPAQSR